MTLFERFDVLCPPDTYIGNMSCSEIRRALAIAQAVETYRRVHRGAVVEVILQMADELLEKK